VNRQRLLAKLQVRLGVAEPGAAGGSVQPPPHSSTSVGRVQVQEATCPLPPVMASPSRYNWSFDACSYALAIFYHLEKRDSDENGCMHLRDARVRRWEQQHNNKISSIS